MATTTTTSATTTSTSSSTAVEVSTAESVNTVTIPNPAAAYLSSFNGQPRVALKGNVVAQSFSIPITTTTGNPQKESSIITSVDLWFKTVDLRVGMKTCFIEIREMVNGYPGAIDKIVGRSVTVELGASNSVDTITQTNGVNFKMLAPCKINAEKQYCLIVNSPSSKTELYVAKRGETTIDGNGIHTQTSNVGTERGSLFVSENYASWIPFLNTDLTFRVNRARFTSAGALAEFKNTISKGSIYRGDIGAYSEGLAIETFENSYYVKVIHPNHGLNYIGAQVHLEGVDSDLTYNNIPGTEINGAHSVEFPTLDSYFIRCTTEANANGKPPVEKFTAFANQSIVYDSLRTQFKVYKSETDEVMISATTTNTNSVNLSTSGDKVVSNGMVSPVSNTPIDVPFNSFHDFESPQIIRDGQNATQNDLVVNLYMRHHTDYDAPFMKTNDGSSNTLVFRNLVGRSLVDSDLDFLTVRTVTTGDTLDNNQKMASYNSALQSIKENSNYVTKQINLEVPADGITIKLDADMEPSSSIEFSYKARQLGDDTPFADLEWQDFPAGQQINENNYNPFSSSYDRKPYTARVGVSHEFTSFKVRIRMRTQNEAQIPSIYDLRIIADL